MNNMPLLMNNMPLLMNKVPLLMNNMPLLMNKVPLLHHLQFVYRTFFSMVTSRMPLMPLFLHDTEVSVLMCIFQ